MPRKTDPLLALLDKLINKETPASVQYNIISVEINYYKLDHRGINVGPVVRYIPGDPICVAISLNPKQNHIKMNFKTNLFIEILLHSRRLIMDWTTR